MPKFSVFAVLATTVLTLGVVAIVEDENGMMLGMGNITETVLMEMENTTGTILMGMEDGNHTNATTVMENSTMIEDNADETDMDTLVDTVVNNSVALISLVLGDFGLADLDEFVAFGDFSASDVGDSCPGEWLALSGCLLINCPFTGIEDACTGGAARRVLASRGLQDTCDNLQRDVCTFSSGEGCCLANCVTEAQKATACLNDIMKEGSDLTSCEIATC